MQGTKVHLHAWNVCHSAVSSAEKVGDLGAQLHRVGLHLKHASKQRNASAYYLAMPCCKSSQIQFNAHLLDVVAAFSCHCARVCQPGDGVAYHLHLRNDPSCTLICLVVESPLGAQGALSHRIAVMCLA